MVLLSIVEAATEKASEYWTINKPEKQFKDKQRPKKALAFWG